MKLDEFAFANQQLAGMIESGLPLEGALRELSSNLSRGNLKRELEALEKDLADGIPLGEAVDKRKLPELYRQTLKVGAKSNDLPAVLTTLADHYARISALRDRARVLLIYPAIVLLFATAISVLFSVVLTMHATEIISLFGISTDTSVVAMQWQIWAPTCILALVTFSFLLLISMRPLRRRMAWALPAFRDVQLVNFSSSLAILMRGKCSLADAVLLLRTNTENLAARAELDGWLKRMEQGESKFHRIAAPTRFFPPLFGWAVASGGEDLAKGFSRAAQIYLSRANYRIEMLLHALLPVCLVIVGGLIISQAMLLIGGVMTMLNRLGS
ncbi:MAG: type II secretion system F family protein [Verrucomicrobiia bacterium]|jgi:general secretion pathway protein F